MKETLGYRLKRERTLRQLSQEALAKALATDETPINKSMISRSRYTIDKKSHTPRRIFPATAGIFHLRRKCRARRTRASARARTRKTRPLPR